MSNALIKFREVHERFDEATVKCWLEYAVREVSILDLILVFSPWSGWLKMTEVERVDQAGAPF